jgi:L-cysteine S-thiosulfotransferase
MSGPKSILAAAVGLGTVALVAVVASGFQGGRSAAGAGAATHRLAAQAPQRPMDAGGHGAHGTPAGWQFTLPKGGDPARGREVFVKLECFTCHEVKGESLPAPDPDKVGPELSVMAAAHSPEYHAESIINPNAVIDKGKGYEGPDGSSKMPSYNDDLTVQELLDLVAYLVGLKPPAGSFGPAAPAPGGHRGH